MRRIRNKTDETLNVPQIGCTLEPGQSADVPPELAYVVFSDEHFDETNDGDENTESVTPERRRRNVDVVNIPATDSASTDEGAK